jgi:hypothetical protein
LEPPVLKILPPVPFRVVVLIELDPPVEAVLWGALPPVAWPWFPPVSSMTAEVPATLDVEPLVDSEEDPPVDPTTVVVTIVADPPVLSIVLIEAGVTSELLPQAVNTIVSAIRVWNLDILCLVQYYV